MQEEKEETEMRVGEKVFSYLLEATLDVKVYAYVYLHVYVYVYVYVHVHV